ncbi:hypothetical protein EV132_13625 [Rhizobium sullae]|uniref:Glycoamylase-like domain-containing protein n=1 Tax=Rhizobium sullae TaxID=50338 RepID=A0A4V2V7U3_RHISU|nr:glucoamylase family protein [Rhizobium sullae]TCU05364.1 hypothetical protein EV132_13625 [Rhizobium sullae]
MLFIRGDAQSGTSSPVVVERGVISRQFAAKIARRQLRYLMELPQGPEPDASGYKGFFYHFLDIENGRRVWQYELSTIDSAFLFAGALTVATFFDRDTAEEAEVRRLANQRYDRADWSWACNGELTLTDGWTPENGFIPHRWRGYDEGLLLYFLGLGSPNHRLEPESYAACTATYEWKGIYGRGLLYSGGPFSPISCRIFGWTFGVFAQQEYAIRNSMNFVGYGQYCWGFTACDGLGWITRKVNGVERQFFDYIARVAPFGPDDGTIAPWVVIASLPFAPETVVPTVRNFARMPLGMTRLYGFKPSFNQSFAVEDNPTEWWISPCHFGID